MDPKVAIVTTLVLYKVVLLGIGFFAARRTRNQADLYLGGFRCPAGFTMPPISARDQERMHRVLRCRMCTRRTFFSWARAL